MENKNTKAGFAWRNTKEEFLCDGAMIKALYERVEEIFIELGNDNYKALRILRIFNYAYNIYWQLTENRQVRLNTQYVDSEHNPNVRIMTYSLVYVLLNVRKFDGLDDKTKDFLRRRISHEWVWDLLMLARKYLEKEGISYPAPATDEPVDFDTAYRLTTAALTEGKRLQEENEKLRRKLETDVQMHENIVASWKQTCDSLSQELATARQKLEAWENNKFYQAVNIGTIVEYAQNQESVDLKVIKMMLLELCANKVDNDVLQKIRQLRSGGNTNINEVGQMYPNATQVTNHYHNHPKDEPND